MDIGFDKLREHLRPTYRAHRTITSGGIQPNIIADTGQIWWFVRDATMPAAKETFDKLVKIAEGAALMTGTTYGRANTTRRRGRSSATRRSPKRCRRTSSASACRSGARRSRPSPRKFQTHRGAAEVGLAHRAGAARPAAAVTSSNDNGDVYLGGAGAGC